MLQLRTAAAGTAVPVLAATMDGSEEAVQPELCRSLCLLPARLHSLHMCKECGGQAPSLEGS